MSFITQPPLKPADEKDYVKCFMTYTKLLQSHLTLASEFNHIKKENLELKIALEELASDYNDLKWKEEKRKKNEGTGNHISE
jgi:hypothetical protein